jgi:hypothetical protein
MSEAAQKFSREYSVLIDGFELLPGDLFRVRGQHGAKFKFQSFVTNLGTGAQWVDCLEVVSNTPSVFRSFKLEQIKRIPNKGRRAKRVI